MVIEERRKENELIRKIEETQEGLFRREKKTATRKKYWNGEKRSRKGKIKRKTGRNE